MNPDEINEPIWKVPPPRASVMPARPPDPACQTITLQIDGRTVTVPAGTTLLQAASRLGLRIPTLCWAPTLTPINACRICVVEVEGARTLAPACARPAEAGMVVQTGSERVRLSRKLVLELLASSVALDRAPELLRLIQEYGADPERFGPSAAPADRRDARHAGHHHVGDGATAETVAQPVKVDNSLYVRDYARCVLCYKCVEACGTDAQHTFAITIAGRGFDARVSTEWDAPLPEGACVYCGNCINVCPTGALVFRTEHELREAGSWAPERQQETDTICPFCGVGCTLRVKVQDDKLVSVTSPPEVDVTGGNLCVKGRFGTSYVNG